MLHQRDRVPALRFAFSDPVIETHLGLSVPYHEGLLKMDLIGEVCDLGNVQQRQVMGRHSSDRFALKQVQDQTAVIIFGSSMLVPSRTSSKRYSTG